MEDTEYEVLRSKFLKIYANVPRPLRDEIIAMVDLDTFTWASANAEIMHNTDVSKKILTQLKEMELI